MSSTAWTWRRSTRCTTNISASSQENAPVASNRYKWTKRMIPEVYASSWNVTTFSTFADHRCVPIVCIITISIEYKLHHHSVVVTADKCFPRDKKQFSRYLKVGLPSRGSRATISSVILNAPSLLLSSRVYTSHPSCCYGIAVFVTTAWLHY